MAAIVRLESDAAESPIRGTGLGHTVRRTTLRMSQSPWPLRQEPGNVGAASRWTAVSVALAPEEAAISLEQEMRQAYAAFAAAETVHVGQAVASTETQSSSATPAVPTETASEVGEVTQDSIAPVPASPAPEAVQTLSAVASAATEAISAAVQLEAVAASYVAETPKSIPSLRQPSRPLQSRPKLRKLKRHIWMSQKLLPRSPLSSQPTFKRSHQPRRPCRLQQRSPNPRRLQTRLRPWRVLLKKVHQISRAKIPFPRLQPLRLITWLQKALIHCLQQNPTLRRLLRLPGPTGVVFASLEIPRRARPSLHSKRRKQSHAGIQAAAMAVAAGAEKHSDEPSSGTRIRC